MTKRPTVENALHALRPDARWSVVYGETDDDYEVVWADDEQTEPTAEEISAELARLAKAWAAEEYRVLRRPLYPRVEEQLDDLFHAGAFSPEMMARIQAVKDAHPKPGRLPRPVADAVQRTKRAARKRKGT